MRLSIVVFACTAVALVEALKTLEVGECQNYLFDSHVKANGYRIFLQGGVLFSHGEDKRLGTLVSPKHALIKTPDDKSFNITTANVKLSVRRLDETGKDSAVKSAKCGPFTVVTLKLGWNPKEPIWNCLASSSEGDPLPWGTKFLVGSNPKTLYTEVTEFSFRPQPQRTCGRNGMVTHTGHVTGGSYYWDCIATLLKVRKSKDLDNIKLQTPNFIINNPPRAGGGNKNRIYGHFDKWIGGEGEFEFTITRFTDADIACIQDIVDEKP